MVIKNVDPLVAASFTALGVDVEPKEPMEHGPQDERVDLVRLAGAGGAELADPVAWYQVCRY